MMRQETGDKRQETMIVGIAALILMSGCRTAAQKTQVPRVDLQLTGAGNRGYLVGTPLPPGEQKVTREMLGITVELPSFTNVPKRGAETAPTESETAVEPDTDAGMSFATSPEQAAPAGPSDTYVVQKGESLWTIAAKPEIYGSATQWRTIFDANRALLKSPDRVRPGMTLRIPRGEVASKSQKRGTVFMK